MCPARDQRAAWARRALRYGRALDGQTPRVNRSFELVTSPGSAETKPSRPRQTVGARPTAKILFLSQGRATESVAMGHVRVTHAIQTGGAGVTPAARYCFSELPPFALWERLLLRRVPGLGERDLWRLRWHLARSHKARRLLTRHLHRSDPDVVHVTTDQVALLLSDLQRRVPCVPSLDSTTMDWLRMLRGLGLDETPADLKPLEALERKALRDAPLSIAWTATVRARIKALAPDAAVEVLHPGLDLETFRPISKPSRSAPLRVLFVGGDWERKGGPDVVTALGPQLGHSTMLDIVTSADVAAQEGVTVHRLGPASPALLELFQRADILCLPTRCDAVPWVVIEALACGVPVIASDIGSIAELVGPGGATFRTGDVAALRDAVGTMAESPALRSSMSQAARARAEAMYDARANTPRLFDLLRTVAVARHGA
jgi:glycosyltransferase involved in cell wall biosynthesis